MDPHRYYQIVRLAIDDQQWYPVTVPIHCATITIENESVGLPMMIRTDVTDQATEKRIPAIAELEIEASVVTFERGDQPCVVRMSSGSGTAVIEFVR